MKSIQGWCVGFLVVTTYGKGGDNVEPNHEQAENFSYNILPFLKWHSSAHNSLVEPHQTPTIEQLQCDVNGGNVNILFTFFTIPKLIQNHALKNHLTFQFSI